MDPWRELEEIEEIETEFYAELMEEPPHGHNHGRSTGEHGWHPLETDGTPPSHRREVEPRKHGTHYVYTKLKCRCDLCKLWKSQYNQRMRHPKV